MTSVSDTGMPLAQRLAELMRFGARLGYGITCVLGLGTLVHWSILQDNAVYCGCSRDPYDEPGHIGIVMAIGALGVVRSFLHARAGRYLCNPAVVARRRALHVYVIVAGIHTLAASLFVRHANGLVIFALAAWPIALLANKPHGPARRVHRGTAAAASASRRASRRQKLNPQTPCGRDI